jgi:hypothetical protein
MNKPVVTDEGKVLYRHPTPPGAPNSAGRTLYFHFWTTTTAPHAASTCLSPDRRTPLEAAPPTRSACRSGASMCRPALDAPPDCPGPPPPVAQPPLRSSALPQATSAPWGAVAGPPRAGPPRPPSRYEGAIFLFLKFFVSNLSKCGWNLIWIWVNVDKIWLC